MKNQNSFFSILISIMLLFNTIPTSATTVNTSATNDMQHTQIMERYLTEMRRLQNEISSIAAEAIKSSSINNEQLEDRIELLNLEGERFYREVQNYYQTVKGISPQNRDALTAFNVLNSLFSSLYTLSTLIRTSDGLQRFTLLDSYFRLRLSAKDSMELLEDLLKNDR